MLGFSQCENYRLVFDGTVTAMRYVNSAVLSRGDGQMNLRENARRKAAGAAIVKSGCRSYEKQFPTVKLDYS